MKLPSYPSYDPCNSYLYVVEIGKNRIKVGQSKNPKTRIGTHLAAARAHGLTPGRHWSSRSRTGSQGNERALIAFCRAQARNRTAPGEYFVGVPFESAVAFARRLPDVAAANVDGTAAAQVVARRCTRERELAALARVELEQERAGQRLYYSVAEAASETAVSPRRIYAALRDGLVPHRRFDRQIRIPASALPDLVSQLT